MYQTIAADVDIYRYPDHANYDCKEIVLGDLHGNTLKLLFALIYFNIADFPPLTPNLKSPYRLPYTKAMLYDEIVKIFRKSVYTLTTEDIDYFERIIAKLNIINHGKLLRLIGDEVADRGPNDIFTLILLKRLTLLSLPLIILFSNHATDLILAYETKGRFEPTVMNAKHTKSMVNMQILIDRKVITREKVIDLIETAYLPHLQAVSYRIESDGTAMTLFKHARSDALKVIEGLAKQLSVPCYLRSFFGLAQTIEKINQQFTGHLRNRTVHTLFDEKVLKLAYANTAPFSDLENAKTEERIIRAGYQDALARSSLNDNAFTHLVFSRRRDLDSTNPRPFGQPIFQVQGHDSRPSLSPHVINLDANNCLGKSVEEHKGVLTTACYGLTRIKQFLPNIALANQACLSATAFILSVSAYYLSDEILPDPQTASAVIGTGVIGYGAYHFGKRYIGTLFQTLPTTGSFPSPTLHRQAVTSELKI